ncbi:MAG: helix-turn-helix transcriptional regulator [Bacteroidetes bacterium]|nr:helix-turn-helix transcriptional regulator [Bacteroidota bacterium]
MHHLHRAAACSSRVRAQGTPMVGTRIRTIRTLRGYKQHYVAREVGIAQSTLSRIEEGLREPSYTTVVRLLRVLHCTHEHLTHPYRTQAELVQQVLRDFPA